jgi:hypothetical protein
VKATFTACDAVKVPFTNVAVVVDGTDASRDGALAAVVEVRPLAAVVEVRPLAAVY